MEPSLPAENDSSTPYEILPNGKKRYTRATGVDIVFSIFLPLWGVVIGGIAALRGETKRGATMMLIGAIALSVFILIRII
jgi:hypothetical protein